MQVGDLVKFKNDGQLGLVVGLALDHLGDTMYCHFVDGRTRRQSLGRRIGSCQCKWVI